AGLIEGGPAGFTDFFNNLWSNTRAAFLGWFLGIDNLTGRSVYGLLLQALGLDRATIDTRAQELLNERERALIERLRRAVASGDTSILTEYNQNLAEIALDESWITEEVGKKVQDFVKEDLTPSLTQRLLTYLFPGVGGVQAIVDSVTWAVTNAGMLLRNAGML